jgi:hypothetical protein
MQPSLFWNSLKLSPVVNAANLLAFPNYCKVIRNSKVRCLSETTSCHHNIFIFTLFLWGRASVAWEPSNKVMLLLAPRKWSVSHFSPWFSLSITLHLTFLSLSLCRLQVQINHVYACLVQDLTLLAGFKPSGLYRVHQRNTYNVKQTDPHC